MSPKAKEYVDKARAIAGDDPDLQFDFGIFCKASGGAQNPDRATRRRAQQRAEADAVPGAEPGAGRSAASGCSTTSTGSATPASARGWSRRTTATSCSTR